MRRIPPILGLDILRRGSVGASPYGTKAGSTASAAISLLLESGGADELLLETGDKLLLESGIAAAKLTELTAAALSTDDLVYVVDDPAGTPASRKSTVSALVAYLLSVITISLLVTETGDTLVTETGDSILVGSS